jgi:exosortase/archaeosortase family protein
MKESNQLMSLILRYLLLILVAIPNLYIFYLILTPLTVYPTFFLLDLFFNVAIQGTSIFIQGKGVIEIIPACVAGSAYYLLLVLNLSIPSVKINKRIKMVIYSSLTLLIINILRIFLLSSFVSSELFNIAHEVFWYSFSTIFVVLIWFSEVKMFKIDKIPVYTDIKFLYRKIKR